MPPTAENHGFFRRLVKRFTTFFNVAASERLSSSSLDHHISKCSIPEDEFDNESESSDSEGWSPFETGALSRDILTGGAEKINENFVLEYEYGQNFKLNATRICKVLKLTSIRSFYTILHEITKLDCKLYPNLFIFVIHFQSDGFQITNLRNSNKTGINAANVKAIKEALVKFSKFRPILLQLTSKSENFTKFYYKTKNSAYFHKIDINQKKFDKIQNFSSFFAMFMNKKFDDFEDYLHDNLTEFIKIPMFIRFIRTLNVSKAFLTTVAFSCAENGRRDDFLASLDVSFEENGSMLTADSEYLVIAAFPIEDSSDAASYESILHEAVKSRNREVIDYLIEQCSYLIQQMLLKHQIEISTDAFNTQQLDVLCDLIQMSDFPFPSNFKENSKNIPELKKIVAERKQLQAAIEGSKQEELMKFINKNPNLKMCYNIKNQSALLQAKNSKQFKILCQLKSFGFQSPDCTDFFENLTKKEIVKLKAEMEEQRSLNVKNSLKDIYRNVKYLCARSRIHNMKIGKILEAKYREKIEKWYKELYTIEFGPELLDAASQNENLKIIFDFESELVENIDMSNADAEGILYPERRWIFIGAKHSNDEREKEIKAVIAHEMCHFVLRLVFENNCLPYYSKEDERFTIFDTIVAKYMMLLGNKHEVVDDGCDGIISIVFQLYPESDHHAEFIVKVVQILAQFDCDEKNLDIIRERYKELFDFYRDFVAPEIKKFNLRQREFLRKLNNLCEVLPEISAMDIKLSASKISNELFNNKVTVISSNIPKLLLINIFTHLSSKIEQKVETRALFFTPNNLKNAALSQDLKETITHGTDLIIVCDCSKEANLNSNDFIASKKHALIYVAYKKNHSNNIFKILEAMKQEPLYVDINYEWEDLTNETQNSLLKREIKFRKNFKTSFLNLLAKDNVSLKYALPNALKDFSEIVDEELLSKFVENQKISINEFRDDKDNDKDYDFLFKPRNLIKIDQILSDSRISTICRKFRHCESIDSKNDKNWNRTLIKQTRGKKIILISDIAGSGKSWMMKNVENVLSVEYPTKWLTYVDLKQFLPVFNAQGGKLNFVSFMIENIIKPKTVFESKVYKKMYENGKVIILFDGFDEIAPDCAEFVTELSALFESNNGNQLWIATRDYFESDLRNRLKIDVAYMLDNLTEEDGIELIASIWLLSELKKAKIEIKSKEEFFELLKKSPSGQKHKIRAKKLSDKALINRFESIGLIHIYNMLAEIYMDNEQWIEKFTEYEIFDKFIDKQYERWSYQKGKIRYRASIRIQKQESTFSKFHQKAAVEFIAPEYADLCDIEYDKKEWPEEEIIACGLMTKKGDKFYFIHVTFAEFFVANFLTKLLKKATKKKNVSSDVFGLLKKIVMTVKFYITRMFLNSALGDQSILQKIDVIASSLSVHLDSNLNDFENIYKIFTNKLKDYDNVGMLLNLMLKKKNYAKTMEIIFRNVEEIWPEDLKSNSTNKVQKNLSLEKVQDIFIEISESSLDSEVLGYVMIKMKEKYNPDIIKEVLKLKKSHGRFRNENLICIFYESTRLSAEKFKKILEIISQNFSVTEFLKVIKNCNDLNDSILHVIVKSANQRCKHLFVKSEIENPMEIFKSFFIAITDVLFKVCVDRNEIKQFLLHKNEMENNFIHYLIEKEYADGIRTVFKILRQNFSDNKYREILKAKDSMNRNFLQFAAYESKNVEIHEVLWKIVYDSKKSNQELITFITEINDEKLNFLAVTMKQSTKDIFELMIEKLEKFLSREELKSLLKSLSNHNNNLLQLAASDNKSLEFHETLWTIYRKYFDQCEILMFIQHTDRFGDNILTKALRNNTKEIIDFTWKMIQVSINENSPSENFKKCDEIIKDVIKPVDHRSDLRVDYNALNLKWIEDKNQKLFSMSVEEFKQQFNQAQFFEHLSDFDYLASCCNPEIVKFSWSLLLKKYENRQKLQDFLISKNFNGSCYIHDVIKYDKFEIIQILINTLDQNFTKLQIRKVLDAKGHKKRNVLQCATYHCKTIQSFELTWNLINKYFKHSEVLNQVEYADDDGNNSVLIAARWGLKAVFEILWNNFHTLSKLFKKNKAIQLIDVVNKKGENILHLTAQSGDVEKLKFLWNRLTSENYKNFEEFVMRKDLEGATILHFGALFSYKFDFHKTMWELLLQKFDNREKLKNFLIATDKWKHSMIHHLLSKDNADVMELIFKIVSDNFSSSQIMDILGTRDELNGNLIHFLAIKAKNLKMTQIVWKTFESFYKNNEKNYVRVFEELNDNSRNPIFLAAGASNSEVFEFIFAELEKIASYKELKEIMSNLDNHQRNIIHYVAANNKSLERHNHLWKIIHKYFNASEILKFINDYHKDGGNVFHVAVTCNTLDVVKLIWNEIKSLMNQVQLKRYLELKDNDDMDLRKCASWNKCDRNVQDWIKKLMNDYKIQQEFIKL